MIVKNMELTGNLTLDLKLGRLRTLVRRQPLNELLALLSSISWPDSKAYELVKAKFGEDKISMVKFKVFIPALAKYAILQSNDHIGTHNRNILKVLKDIFEAIDLIIDIKDFLSSKFSEVFSEQLKYWFFITANQQSSFQELPINSIARFLILYKQIPEEISLSVNISSFFLDNYGVSIERYYLIALMSVLVYKGSWVKSNNYVGLNSPPYNFTAEELNRFFNSLSLNYEQFREKALDESLSFVGKSEQFFGYSPFDSHPLISRQDEELNISPYYFIKRVSQSIYFNILKHFQESENLAENEFSREFGRIFEFYVGKQLKCVIDQPKLIQEFDNDGTKFADWSILENEHLVLIEVKKNLLRQKDKYSLNKEELLSTLETGILKGLRQCYKKIEAVKSCVSGLEQFHSATKFYPVVIVFDDSYLLNGEHIRSIIDETLEIEGISFEIPWQILTIRELEHIVSACEKGLNFLELLKEKTSTSVFVEFEWFRFLEGKKIIFDENSLLNEVLNDFFDSVNII